MRRKFKIYIDQNNNLIKRLISIFIVFGIFKSLAFIAPLGIHEILNSDDLYGKFEYSFNLGQALTGIFSMGLVGSYGYFVLKNHQKELIPLFHFHFLALTAILCLVTLCFPNLITNNYFGAAILGVAFADQIMISGILKINGYNKLSILVDTGVYIIMGILVIFILIGGFKYSEEVWYSSILFCLVGTSLLFHLKRAKDIKDISTENIIRVYKFGGLILIISPLLVLLTSSTRLYIEYYASFTEVGIYSFYFRLASFILIIYRVFGIMLFRKFFIENHKKLDNFYTLIISGLFAINIFLFFSLPIILKGHYPKYEATFETHSDLFLLCMFQITFWINISLFEPIFQRENKLLWFMILLFLSILILTGCFYIFNSFNLLSLNVIVVINSIVIYLMFFGQQFILNKSGVRYPKTNLTHVSLGLIYFTILLIYIF